MSASAETVITAGLRPELFEKRGALQIRSRTLLLTALALITLMGFGFRATELSAEGLSEDELNKLQAVEEYRRNGLSSVNGEHPFLMKALMTISIVGAERWNASSLAAGNPSAQVSTETALRLPVTIFGAATSLLIFLLVSELFGTEIALISAVLWALDPTAIGFNRVAKEDSFLLFFLLLANVFWLKSQRAAESGERNPEPLYWATAAAYGAMMASKYLPHLMAIGVSYYYIFQGIPQTRWRMGKKRFFIFFIVMGVVFLICNPTILLPGTWHEMRTFAGEKRIGHGSYEFMGTVYLNQLSLWLKGMPWYFYYVFMGVKLPLVTVASFLIGLPLIFRKRLGDGRYFLFFWLLFWFMPFTVMGGKYTRYFTTALPLVLITAAIGLHFSGQLLERTLSAALNNERAAAIARASLIVLALFAVGFSAASAQPYYRLYTNALGTSLRDVGSYFPHDEFYDASVRDAAREVAHIAGPGARVASETPGLFDHYTRLAGRSDLVFIPLSDEEAVRGMKAGDIVIVARGRRYLTNDAFTTSLQKRLAPAVTVSLGQIPSVQIFVLNQAGPEALAGNIGR